MESNEFNKNEVKHFKANPNGINDAYGYVWNIVVKEYLKMGYKGEQSKCEVDFHGVKYKILKREEITSFYDEAGNTLFDVENERLEKEYEELINAPADPEDETDISGPRTQMGKTIADIERQAFENVESNEKDVVEADEQEIGIEINSVNQEKDEQIKDRAIKKLDNDLKKAKDKSFIEPIISYLQKRCEEDKGLSEDIMQEHKTWEKCFEYIYSKAKEQAGSVRYSAVSSDVVFEWAEDYYHKDDKAEEEEKRKEEKQRKEKAKAVAEKREKKNSLPAGSKFEKKATLVDKQEPPMVNKSNKDIEGQMDMFSLMGL